jgi:hypothetical protein
MQFRQSVGCIAAKIVISMQSLIAQPVSPVSAFAAPEAVRVLVKRKRLPNRAHCYRSFFDQRRYGKSICDLLA